MMPSETTEPIFFLKNLRVRYDNRNQGHRGSLWAKEKDETALTAKFMRDGKGNLGRWIFSKGVSRSSTSRYLVTI